MLHIHTYSPYQLELTDKDAASNDINFEDLVLQQIDIEHDDGEEVGYEGPCIGRAIQRRARRQRRLAIASPNCTLIDPFGVLVGEGTSTVHHIGRWYFHQQLDDSLSNCYTPAIRTWVDIIWDMARDHDVMFNAIVAMALHKKSALNHSSANRQYLLSKTRMLRQTAERIPSLQRRRDNRLAVAIALLAYFEIRDGDFDAAETHLKAVPLLSAVETWSVHEWLYCSWIDLRFALFRGRNPILPFYVPAPYRDDLLPAAQYRKISHKLALAASKHAPKSNLVSSEIWFQTFRILHEIGMAWDEFHVNGTVPFGSIYTLEYQFRTMQVCVQAQTGEAEDVAPVELMLLGLQIHLWTLARFWAPQRRETYEAVLDRAQYLLATNDILETWLSTSDLSCLQWVLFTLAASASDLCHTCESHAMALLSEVTAGLYVKGDRDFSRKLKKWPWLENYHQSKLEHIWPQLRHTMGLPWASWRKVGTEDRDRDQRPMRCFFGGLEFFAAS